MVSVYKIKKKNKLQKVYWIINILTADKSYFFKLASSHVHRSCVTSSYVKQFHTVYKFQPIFLEN